jgi:hypothetical protein
MVPVRHTKTTIIPDTILGHKCTQAMILLIKLPFFFFAGNPLVLVVAILYR